jgi:uncharacterized membrane protein YgcG
MIESRLRLLALLALLLLPSAAVWAQAGERILDYEIEVEVNADGSLEVTEHITVRAEGREIRRGIYRDFPTRYRDRHGNNVVVGLEVLGVERDGAREPWFTEWRMNGVRINTGDDTFLPGLPAQYRYTLRYRTTRQLGFFAEHDELYWNAIGTGWDFAIDAGRVEVRLPQAVPVPLMHAEGYTGPQGAQRQAYRATLPAPGVARWELAERLAPREGFTIVLTFPKGLVPEPSRGQRLVWLLQDNRGVLVALGGFLLLLLYCARRWHRVGRDPRPGVVIARYEPPAERSPAELRYLRRRRYDPRCFTSDLLSCAVAGGVGIERERRRLRSDRWRLHRTEQPGASTYPTVASLIASLFRGRDSTIELTKKHATRLQRARQVHAKALDRRLHGSHFERNVGSIVAAIAIAVASIGLAVLVSGGGGILLIAAIGVLMILVVAVFGYLVQAPTEEGRRLLDETKGLELYLSVAERDELAAMQGPEAPPPIDAARYQRLLPYAVALDVEEAWTRKFTAAVGAAAAAATTAGIAWYRGGGVNDLGGLVKAVGSGLTSSIASASTPPGSTSGAGGGGSSGGGGGGGGGGGR